MIGPTLPTDFRRLRVGEDWWVGDRWRKVCVVLVGDIQGEGERRGGFCLLLRRGVLNGSSLVKAYVGGGGRGGYVCMG